MGAHARLEHIVAKRGSQLRGLHMLHLPGWAGLAPCKAMATVCMGVVSLKGSTCRKCAAVCRVRHLPPLSLATRQDCCTQAAPYAHVGRCPCTAAGRPCTRPCQVAEAVRGTALVSCACALNAADCNLATRLQQDLALLCFLDTTIAGRGRLSAAALD